MRFWGIWIVFLLLGAGAGFVCTVVFGLALYGVESTTTGVHDLVRIPGAAGALCGILLGAMLAQRRLRCAGSGDTRPPNPVTRGNSSHGTSPDR